MTTKRGSSQLGRKIRRLRQQLGLTQEELGERAHIHYSYVGQVERGDKMPSLRTLKNLAAALNVDLHYLLEEPVPYQTTENPAPDDLAAVKTLLQGRSPAEIRLCLDLIRLILRFLDGRDAET
ncbi:MAG: helix-turn-helix transcriptional regulator [Firmicutes bacterium]|nr:helix-turn-helix transcriptional regulator [Bacillota bacterium]